VVGVDHVGSAHEEDQLALLLDAAKESERPPPRFPTAPSKRTAVLRHRGTRPAVDHTATRFAAATNMDVIRREV
jgi:hypothetical protein